MDEFNAAKSDKRNEIWANSREFWIFDSEQTRINWGMIEQSKFPNIPTIGELQDKQV